MLRRASSLAALLAFLALAAPALAGAANARGHGDDGAIVVVSGDVTVARGESVDGVYVGSGDVRIDGRVAGDVVVLSGDVLVAGTIEGDLFTASGTSRLLPSAEVTGDVNYADNHPEVSNAARVHGDVSKKSLPDLGGVSLVLGGFLVWLANSVSMVVLGLLLLLLAPRAAEVIAASARERIGPTIAIGIAIAIALPVGAALAAITVLALPLALVVLLALLPLAAVAYVTAAWALGRRLVKQPRDRFLTFLAGIGILRAVALIPIVGGLVDLAAVVVGLGLLGAAIGAARGTRPRSPSLPPPPGSPGS